VTAWPPEEIDRIAASGDLYVAPFRFGGATCLPPERIWAVVVDGRLFGRPWNGTRARWYRAAMAHRAGRVTVADYTYDVAFAPADPVLFARIDDAYSIKYKGSPDLPRITAARPRSATVEVIRAMSVEIH
jgi:hypothetical protein